MLMENNSFHDLDPWSRRCTKAGPVSAATGSRGLDSPVYSLTRPCRRRIPNKSAATFLTSFLLTRPGRCASGSAFVDPHQCLFSCTLQVEFANEKCEMIYKWFWSFQFLVRLVTRHFSRVTCLLPGVVRGTGERAGFDVPEPHLHADFAPPGELFRSYITFDRQPARVRLQILPDGHDVAGAGT